MTHKGTHSHSGPAGYFDYFLFQFTSKGFIDDVLYSLVTGTVESIVLARENSISCVNCESIWLKTKTGKLFNSNINRSPSSYYKNKPEDIEFYSEGRSLPVILPVIM